MAKFFKNLFSHGTLSPEKKKYSKSKPELMTEDDNREFSAPYDTKRKLSVSRSGRMKQNLKVRGSIAKDLFGNDVKVEKTSIEYHVHGKSYHNTLKDSMANGTNNSTGDINLHQSQGSLNKVLSERGDIGNHVNHLDSSEKQRKRKDNSYSEEEANHNDKTDLDIEIENVFNIVLKETSF